MADNGITSFGAYVPRLRLERTAIAAVHRWMAPSLKGLAKGERAFASWDEDAITMAVEAARDALGGSDRGAIEALTLASTTFPYADLQNSAIAIGALGLDGRTRASDVGGSQRAGLGGLVQALRTGPRDALYIASDRPRAKPASVSEMGFGAGAAAFRLGSENMIARIVGAANVTTQFIDHFRASDHDHDYFWEERWVRDEGHAKLLPEVVRTALDEAGVGIADVTTLVMASPLRGSAVAVAKRLGFTGTLAADFGETIGYAGTAQPLLMLAGALEEAKPGDRILVLAFGTGAEALLLEVTDAIEPYRKTRGHSLAGRIADRIVTGDYLRMASFYGEIDLDWGMRAEKGGKAALTTLYREAGQLAALVAGKCRACGTVQFPQLPYCVNSACQAKAAFEQISLVDEPAKVLTFTADHLSYYPAPPAYVGFAQFEIGARLLMEIVDVGARGLEVGTPLRLVYRIKEPDKARGFNRYFWKATPVASEG